MTTNRLEAFSDGVIAIIITIMVLEMKVPEGFEFTALKPLIPKFLSYLLSFIYVGIYWNNHHHLFQAIQKINGSVLWSNLFLLFTLSLIPFTTAWMGENNFTEKPVALYGFNLLFCAFAFFILEISAVKNDGENSTIWRALQNKNKEYISLGTYIVSSILAFYVPLISVTGFAFVALLWLVPDRRIEKHFK